MGLLSVFWTICIGINFLVINADDHVHGHESSHDDNHTSEEHHWTDMETHLHEDLLHGYQKTIRPIKNENAPVNISIGVALVKILDVNTQQHTITLGTWQTMNWIDYRLQWNSEKYDNMTNTRMGKDIVWYPDVTLYNGVKRAKYVGVHGPEMLVYSDGKVLWVPHVIFTSHCDFDLSNFPFDEHTCTLKYGSWVYSALDISLKLSHEGQKADMNNLFVHHQWEVKALPAKKTIKKFDCCPESYEDIEFSFTLKRTNEFYKGLFIGPAIIFGFLLSLQFLLDRGTQRIIINMSVVLGSLMMIILFEFMIPASTSNVPKIVADYMTLPIIAVLCIFCGIITQCISRCTMAMPSCLKQFVNCIGIICCTRSEADKYAKAKGFREMAKPGDFENQSEAGDGDNVPIHYQKQPNDAVEWYMLGNFLDRFSCLAFALICAIAVGAF